MAEGEGDTASGATRAHEQEALPLRGETRLLQGGDEAAAIGVVAGEAAAIADDGVDGANPGGEGRDLVEEGQDSLLVGDGDVRAEAAALAQRGNARGEVVEGGVPAVVGSVDASRAQGGALDGRRERVGDGMADDAETGAHRSTFSHLLGSLCSVRLTAKQCEPSSVRASTT